MTAPVVLRLVNKNPRIWEVAPVSGGGDLGDHEIAPDPHEQYVTDADLTNYVTGDDLAGHVAAPDPHPAYATDQNLADHVSAPDPHPVYATSAEVDADVAAHAAASNPHPVYATDADLSAHASTDSHAIYTTATELNTAFTTHENASNPHPTYATDADLTAHVDSTNPHPDQSFIVGRNRRVTSFASTGPILRALSVTAPVVAGRTYRVWAQGEIDAFTAPATTQTELRFTTNNTEPLVTSPVLGRTLIDHRVNGVPDGVHIDVLFVATANGTLRVAWCIQRVVGAGNVTLNAAATSPAELVIEDTGLTVGTTGTVY